jgi:hypothetical protein
LAGDASVKPTNGIGSNIYRPAGESAIPKIVCMGGGIPPEEADELAKAVKEHAKEGTWKEEVHWVKVPREEMRKIIGGSGPPSPEVSADLCRRIMKEMGI